MDENPTEDTSCMKPLDVLKSDINILLLGESGVGKSTFINAFANYLEYEKYETAKKSKLACLIPAKFSVFDDNFTEHVIKIGKDSNENEKIGDSSTQGTRAYVFPLKGHKIRLIDTPGIGDTRGMDQDKENFENILTYISNFDYIHAICFLLKPDQAVRNKFFEFCLLELLSRLEKSASNNIMFLFTNSRSTNYKPGMTLSNIKMMLEKIEKEPPHVKIPWGKENVFCFDNEAFRYLAARSKGIIYGKEEDIVSSWDTSVKTCWNFIRKICANMKPHEVGNTISVNKARKLVVELTKPLTDISELIEDNLLVLERHKNDINEENLSLEELHKKLYVPIINIRQTSLPDPIMVCTAPSCTDVLIISGVGKYHHKTKCHKPCLCSTSSSQAIIGSPDLLYCEKFDPNKKCKTCGCFFSCHMKIFYTTEIFQDNDVDSTVQKEINSVEEGIKLKEEVIEKIKDRTMKYNEEKTIIAKSITAFGQFLKDNSITVYNDAYDDYMQYLIERENSKGPEKNKDLIKRYEDLRKHHEKENEIFSVIKESCQIEKVITIEIVEKQIELLYSLDFTGKKIRELHKKQQTENKKHHLRLMEYSHPNMIKKPEDKKSKNKKKGDIPEELLQKIKDLNICDENAIKTIVENYLKHKNAVNPSEVPENKEKPAKNKKKTNFKAKSKAKKGAKESDGEEDNLSDHNNERNFAMPPSSQNQFPNMPRNVGNNMNQFVPPQNHPGNNPNQFGNFPNQFANNPNEFGNIPNQFGNNSNQFDNVPNQFVGNIPNQFVNNPNRFPNVPNQFRNIPNVPNQFGNFPNQFNNNPNQFGNNQQMFHNNPNQYGNNRNEYGNIPNQYGNNPFHNKPFPSNSNNLNKYVPPQYRFTKTNDNQKGAKKKAPVHENKTRLNSPPPPTNFNQNNLNNQNPIKNKIDNVAKEKNQQKGDHQEQKFKPLEKKVYHGSNQKISNKDDAHTSSSRVYKRGGGAVPKQFTNKKPLNSSENVPKVSETKGNQQFKKKQDTKGNQQLKKNQDHKDASASLAYAGMNKAMEKFVKEQAKLKDDANSSAFVMYMCSTKK